jgi:hypothetical protein
VNLPPRLRQRGIQPAAWSRLTDAQQRQVIKESDSLVRSPTAKKTNAAERARRFAQVTPEQRADWWRKYGKAEETEDFWTMYSGFVQVPVRNGVVGMPL